MKKNFWFAFLASFLLILFSSCNEKKETSDSEKGSLSFSITDQGKKSSTLAEAAGLDDVAEAVVTISKGGSTLDDYNNKTIGLNDWGDGTYTTESIELEVGSDYELTQFQLKNASDQVVFAIPNEGSDLASEVNDPLPIAFEISSGTNKELSVEVIGTAGEDAASFGYASFAVDNVTAKDPAEVKMDFENVGMALMDKMSGLMTTKSMKLIESFSYYASMADPMANKTKKSREVKALDVVYNLSQFADNQKSITQVLKYSQSEPSSIQDLYDELTGQYSWNPSTDSWDYAASDQVVFKFPSVINEVQVNQATNNAVFTIEEYTGTPVTLKYIPKDEYNGDVPASLLFNMTLDGNKVLDYSMSATYDSDGFPSNISQSLVMDDYEIATQFTNDQAELTSSFDFNKADASLYSTDFSVTGDFSVSSLDNNVIEYWREDSVTYEEIQISASDTAIYDDWWIEVYPEDILNGGSMSITLMSEVQLAGTVDIAAIVDEYETLDQSEWTDQSDKDMINAIDDNTELYATYVVDNKKIADIEIYPFEDSDTYTTYEWNEITEMYEENEVTETWIDPMFILKFSDGSQIDLGTYYDAGDWGMMELQQLIFFTMKDI